MTGHDEFRSPAMIAAGNPYSDTYRTALAGVAVAGAVISHAPQSPRADNDIDAPRRRLPGVALPAHVRLTARRERAVDVSISRETVTFAAPDADVATKPLASYKGIAVSVEAGEGGPTFHLTLAHEDPAHSVPLSEGSEIGAVAREWQAWAKALQLPLIAIDQEGAVRGELTALGVVLAEQASPRRRGSPLVGRRSRYGRRRRAVQPIPRLDGPSQHRGEREIIART